MPLHCLDYVCYVQSLAFINCCCREETMVLECGRVGDRVAARDGWFLLYPLEGIVTADRRSNRPLRGGESHNGDLPCNNNGLV